VKSVQIQLELKASAPIPSSNKVVLTEGDIYHALIKERKPGNEAVLQIRGKDVNVKFEGEVPSGNKIAIQITKVDGQPPVVKELPLANSAQTTKKDTTAIFQRMNGGAPLSNSLKSAVNLVLKKGVPLNKDTFQAIKKHVEGASGTQEQKLESISILVKKELPLTENRVKAVHQALHSKSYAQSLESLLKEINPEFSERIHTFKNSPITSNEQPKQQVDVQNKQAYQLKQIALQRVQEVISSIGKNITNQPVKQEALQRIKAELAQTKNIEQAVQKIRNMFSTEARSLSTKLMEALKIDQTATKLVDLQAGSKATNGAQPTETMNRSGPNNPATLAQETMATIKANVSSLMLDALNKSTSSVKKEADFSKVIEQISKLLSTTENLSDSQKKQLETSINKAAELDGNGKEMAARQEVLTSLTKLQQELAPQVNQKNMAPPTEAYKLQEELLASLPIHSKNIIVEKVTKKLSQVTIDFKNFKNDISRSLQTVDQLIRQYKSRAAISAKPLLETTIKKLDQAILRSDFMLFADMKTEKKLLTASAQLAEARKLLAKGEHSQANRIVTDIKNQIDKLVFKPSDVRVKHYVSEEMGRLENLSLQKQASQQIEQSMQSIKHAPTARSSYEYLRALGLTNEADHAHTLVGKDKQDALNPNLKDMLFKLAQSEDGQLVSKTDSLLTNLTGQQLLSKTDSSGLQNLMFTLPLLLQDKLENVKVFVNSQSENQNIDWENCSLFFLFETKKLGEVGIALTSSERNLLIKIKNDTPGFKEKMEPLAALAKGRLEDIGYKIGNIQFSTLNKMEASAAQNEPIAEKKHSTITEKGYDFSI
jgi:hypothetical protein